MHSLTRKPQISSVMKDCVKIYRERGVDAFSDCLHAQLLTSKVRFPLLEYAAELIHELIPEEEHLPICDRVSAGQSIGGNVIIGKLLQLHLPERLEPTLQKSADYIAQGTEWYVSDIIGERVIGHALLQDSDTTLRVLRSWTSHPSNLVVRSIGAGVHLSLKRGLGRAEAEQAFGLLLSLSSTKDYQVKRGIGWAAKTTARYHPEIIEQHRLAIDEAGQWFRTKVKIGLERHAYAEGN